MATHLGDTHIAYMYLSTDSESLHTTSLKSLQINYYFELHGDIG